MKEICERAPNSPLCGKNDLYLALYKITQDRVPKKDWGKSWEILLWQALAESHIGQNYTKDNQGGTCYGRYNMGGTKYQIHDNNTRTYSRSLNGFLYWRDYYAERIKINPRTKHYGNFSDQYACNLYPFKSYEEYWITKVNGLRYGYKSCMLNTTQPLRCISYQYVGNPLVAEESWIKNASSFLN